MSNIFVVFLRTFDAPEIDQGGYHSPRLRETRSLFRLDLYAVSPVRHFGHVHHRQ